MDNCDAFNKLGAKCSKCDESKEFLLRFHFVGESPNKIYFFEEHKNSASEEEVLVNLSKCEILCVECIRKMKVNHVTKQSP